MSPVILHLQAAPADASRVPDADDFELIADELWQTLTVLKGTSQLLLRSFDRDIVSVDERDQRLQLFLRNIDLAATDATRVAARLIEIARSAMPG